MARSGRPQDHHGRRARREGYPARSVYKLEEIDKRLRLLTRGKRVLDLGGSPGSWALFAGRQVGPGGRVVCVDLKPLEVTLPDHGRFIRGDVYDLTAEELGGADAFDVVLSDMAPATTGQKHLDQYRSFELFARALELASAVLVTGGAFVGKIFQGAEMQEARRAVAERFETARVIKPGASRSESYELFIAGLGRR